MKRCRGFLKHKWQMIKGERVCVRCGRVWESDGEKDHQPVRPSDPKPDNSRKKRKSRRHDCKARKRRDRLVDAMMRRDKRVKDKKRKRGRR